MTRSETGWRRSSYSGGTQNDCVEVANTREAVRDSKNPVGPAVRLDLSIFLNAVKAGLFDRL
jgi:hypothetical protein